nr:peptidyl-prolyl cis-trans isomerase FKBP62-like isoform X1 [Tanacetum cinerariifolium]
MKMNDSSSNDEEEEEAGEVIESAPPQSIGEVRIFNSTGLTKNSSDAILTMKKREISLFTLSPDLGFGALGADGVPPNSVIQFEIKLISWITVVDVCKDGGILRRVVKKGEHTGKPGDLNEVKGNDVPAYTERFQELTLICTKFVANEIEKIDKYISGLPDNIYGSVKASKPKTLDETIELKSGSPGQTSCSRGLKALLTYLNGSKKWSQYSTLAVVPLTIKVKGHDVAAYTQRFQELALMCTKFLADETEKVEKYISGLLDDIHGNVMSVMQ